MTVAPTPEFKLGQKLEVFGLPDFNLTPEQNLNGNIVQVVALPGWDRTRPHMYHILFLSGRMKGTKVMAEPEYLRPLFTPERDDMDKPSSWKQFQKATGINPNVVKNGRP